MKTIISSSFEVSLKTVKNRQPVFYNVLRGRRRDLEDANGSEGKGQAREGGARLRMTSIVVDLSGSLWDIVGGKPRYALTLEQKSLPSVPAPKISNFAHGRYEGARGTISRKGREGKGRGSKIKRRKRELANARICRGRLPSL